MIVLQKNQLPKSLSSVLGSSCPEQLYVKGNIDALSLPSVGIVGTRKPSESTIEFIEDKVSELADSHTIVSGLALGCDKIAHQSAINNDGITIAVLPSGVNNVVPVMHRKLAKEIIETGGCLVSEYEPTTKASKNKFIARNRITATLSDKLIVAECNVKSGTMHTVKFASKYNIPIEVNTNANPASQYILNNFKAKAI